MWHDLPMFDTHEVAWSQEEIIDQASNRNRSHIIRRLRGYQWPIGYDLESYLAISRNELGEAADRCGATLVNYEVGIAAVPAAIQRRYDYRNPLYDLPRGSALVARVERIADAQPVQGVASALLYRALADYAMSRDGYQAIWTDTRSEQFVIGMGSASKTKSLYLVDIDHLIKSPVRSVGSRE